MHIIYQSLHPIYLFIYIFCTLAIIKTYRWQCEVETTSITRQAKASITTQLPSRANYKLSRYPACYSATNQEHLKRTQQPQEGGANPEKRERHPRVSPHYEDCRCQKEPF